MTYIHLSDDFDKLIDVFHAFKNDHSDDIVTTNYDSVTKSIYVTLHNGDAHDFMGRSFQIVRDRLQELGCNGFTIRESDINEISLIRVCDTYQELKAIYDKEMIEREDLLKYGSIADGGNAVLKFRDGTYEVLLAIHHGYTEYLEDVESRR